MKKIGRLFVRIALSFVAVILLSALAVFMFLDPLIKHSINVYAPQMLGVPVSVDSIQIRPLRGKIYLKEFSIGNPQGYSTNAPLFAVQQIQVALDVLSLTSDVIRIHLIDIENPFIHYETQNGKSNIDALMANLKTEKKAEEKEATATSSTSDSPAKSAKKVIIDDFSLSGAKVSYKSTLTLNKQVIIPIPPFELRDIGKSEGGISAIDATLQIFGSIISHIGDGITELGKTTIKGAGDVLNSATEGGTKAIDSAVKSIKKLF